MLKGGIVTAVALVGAGFGAVLAGAHVDQALRFTPPDRQRLAKMPAAPLEETFAFEGRRIAPSEAAKAGLACVERNLRTTCYRSEAELETADGQVPRSVWSKDGQTWEERNAASPVKAKASWRRSAAFRHRTRRHRHASAANHDNSYPQSLWQHTYAAGWRIDRYSSCVWHNLQDFYNDNTSSYKTGNHTGVFAWDTYGGGSNREDGPYAYLQTLGNWSDEISSSLRMGC